MHFLRVFYAILVAFVFADSTVRAYSIDKLARRSIVARNTSEGDNSTKTPQSSGGDNTSSSTMLRLGALTFFIGGLTGLVML